MDLFSAAMIMSHLTAMKNGSAEARQRFPRLLQIVDYYPETIGTFCKKVAMDRFCTTVVNEYIIFTALR